jgi:hypothetical protein
LQLSTAASPRRSEACPQARVAALLPLLRPIACVVSTRRHVRHHLDAGLSACSVGTTRGGARAGWLVMQSRVSQHRTTLICGIW